MEKFVLYVGLLDKDAKVQIISTDTAKDIISMVCGDCTIIEGQGRYTHANGEKISEPTLVVELLFKTHNEVVAMAKALKDEAMLNQETIAMQTIKLEYCDLV